VSWPDDVSKTFFVLRKLEDSAGKLISDNPYWLWTEPDTPGKPRESANERSFSANLKSIADFTSLQRLKPVKVKTGARFEQRGSETIGQYSRSQQAARQYSLQPPGGTERTAPTGNSSPDAA
jgi:hypothetical protein